MTTFEKALERAGGSQKLAQLLVDVVSQFITPREDPIYDWQIVPLSRVCGTRVIDRYTWGAELPEVVETGRWTAPARQCALAWGSRLAAGQFHEENAHPTPVAVLVHAVRGEDGELHAEIGATFLYAQNGRNPGWFAPRGSAIDRRVAALVIGFLNGQQRNSPVQNGEGVDLD